jgi:nucleoside-diphosphate-sugar epimerase
MKVLVTGARGFIGQSLCRLLTQLDVEVVKSSRTEIEGYLKLDFLDEDTAEAALEALNPDAIINLSWNASGVDYLTSSENARSLAWSRNLFFASSRLSMKKIISLGSAAEKSIPSIDRLPVLQNSPYADSKRQAYRSFSEVFRSSGIDHHWLRVFQVYGDGQSGDRFIPSLKFHLENDLRFQLRRPSLIRDWIHVDDVAIAIATTLQSDLPSEFDVGTSIGSSNLDICNFLQQNFGLEFEYKEFISNGYDDALVASSSTPLFSIFKPRKNLFDYLMESFK